MRTPDAPPEFCRWTMSDGCELRGRLWRGPAARRSILYLHGIQSHGGWFEWSAARLAATGATVLLPDRRGSGLNSAARGDVPNWRRWLVDVDEHAAWLAAQTGRPRCDMVGVSWGGKLATAWALTRPAQIDRLLLIAPGLFPQVDVGWLNRARIGVALLAAPTRLLPIPLSDPALFTAGAAGQAFIAQDLLKLTHATARFFYQSTRLDALLVRAAARALAAPTTLVLADRERIVRNRPTRAWLERIVAQPPVIRTLAAAHTLEFEDAPAEFETLLAAWGAGEALPA
jgi:acylglycerol lipase